MSRFRFDPHSTTAPLKRQLTVLQRRVIQRLRDAHFDALADAADGAWRRAESYPLDVHIADAELVADYQKANTQLLTGFVDRRLAR